MSAALQLIPQAVVPRIWATADNDRPTLARAAEVLTHRSTQTFAPGRRKGPHSLRLVQAQAPQAATLAAHKAQPAPRAVPVRAQPALAIYRCYTEALLRRYLKLSLEAGRSPSLIGQDVFRGSASHSTVTGFDDGVNFVVDLDRCLAMLDPAQRFLIRKIAIEGHTQGETAAMRGLPMRSVIRRYVEAVDRLTRLFLERGIMKPMTDPDLD